MKKIKNKLQDSHGVSILFALLLMAVAAMVSITIISASISAVKRSHAIKNTRQELLSLDSATLYIEKQLNSDTGASEVSFSQNTDGTYSVTNTNQYGGAFKEEVIALTNAFLTGNRGNEIGTFSLKTEDTSNNTCYDSVSVSYKVVSQDNEQRAIVVFTLRINDSKQYLKYNVNKNTSSVSWTFFEASGKE